MAARTSRLVPDGALVLGLGDMAYPLADAQTLASCYEPTWGRHRAATLATPGNHDYVRGSASDFLEYFGVDALHDGGFIAFTRALTADWRLIALDSNVDGSALQAQYEWLERLFAAGGASARAGRKAACSSCGMRRCIRRECIGARVTRCGPSGN